MARCRVRISIEVTYTTEHAPSGRDDWKIAKAVENAVLKLKGVHSVGSTSTTLLEFKP